MTNIRVQSKVTAVEIDFGPKQSSLVFEREGNGIVISRVSVGTDVIASVIGSLSFDQFEEFKIHLSKIHLSKL